MRKKSQTKKLLMNTNSKSKVQIETMYKKHKSQESLSDLANTNQINSQKILKNLNSPKMKPENKNLTKNINLNIAKNPNTNSKIKNVLNLIDTNKPKISNLNFNEGNFHKNISPLNQFTSLNNFNSYSKNKNSPKNFYFNSEKNNNNNFNRNLKSEKKFGVVNDNNKNNIVSNLNNKFQQIQNTPLVSRIKSTNEIMNIEKKKNFKEISNSDLNNFNNNYSVNNFNNVNSGNHKSSDIEKSLGFNKVDYCTNPNRVNNNNNIFSFNNANIINTEENEYENDNNKSNEVKESLEEFDEIKSNGNTKDFYTNSIAESNSLMEKSEGIINNIPNTFVKQSEKKNLIQKSSKNYLENFTVNNKFDRTHTEKIFNISNNNSNYPNENENAKKTFKQNASLNKLNSTNSNTILSSLLDNKNNFMNFKEKNKEKIEEKINLNNYNTENNTNNTNKISDINLLNDLDQIEIDENFLNKKSSSKNKKLFNNNSNAANKFLNTNTNSNNSFKLNNFFTKKSLTEKKINTQNLNNTNANATLEKSLNINNKINNKTNTVTINNTSMILYNKFLTAARKGDRELFLEVLSEIYRLEGQDTNICFKDENSWTALHYAADEGNLKIVEILMKMNIDNNIKTAQKKTALHLSSEKGYFDVSKMLIENGALLNLFDDEKNSPLHLCAQKGHLELLKFYLDKNPQVDKRNIYGKTPLDLSANDKISKILKEYLYSNNNNININKESINTNNKTNLINKFSIKKIKIHNASNENVNEFLNINSNIDQINNNNNKTILNKDNNNNSNNLSDKDKDNNNIINKNSNFNTNSNSSKKAKLINSQFNQFSNSNKSDGKKSQKKLKSGNQKSDSSNSLSNISNIDFKIAKEYTNFSNSKKMKFDQTEIYSIENSINSNSNSNKEIINSTEEEKIGPFSFICHALLGKGSFGEVYLVEKKDTNIFYAMKVLSKDKIMGQNLIKYAMTERNVLSFTNHPFIVKLNYAFQSNDKLFLILDYCPGGDLSQHLSKEKRFTEERAKIYLCEIILALEDLHKRDIIFRDLKPDNVVLDFEGHAQLTDFGLSKEGVYDNKAAKSFCGSIAYLAPEMLKRSGHGKSVDWYLLGVLFYEMLVGLPPFFNSNKDQLFKNIETQELQLPKIVGDNAGKLLKSLLVKDPLVRLGSGKGDAEEIKKHVYFKNVNWKEVYQKKLKPPVPSIKSKYIKLANTPEIFEDNNKNINENSEKYFDNWSFIKNN